VPPRSQQIDEEEAKLPQGEQLSLDRISDIFLRVSRQARTLTNQSSGTRNEQGEFNDFLEKRRPFLNPRPDGNSH
jgi:hypothetical protein